MELQVQFADIDSDGDLDIISAEKNDDDKLLGMKIMERLNGSTLDRYRYRY